MIKTTDIPTSHKVRKFILVFISIISIVILFIAHITFYNYPGDNYLGIFFLGHLHVIHGIIRFCASLKTNLSIWFRIQDFIYAFLTVFPIFNILELAREQEMTFGQITSLACLICSVYWTIKIMKWKFTIVKTDDNTTTQDCKKFNEK